MNERAIEELGKELDAIEAEVKASLGERDRRYITRLIRIQRGLALTGRAVIFASLPLVSSGAPFFCVLASGAVMLGIAKILENMEIGHNVLHGQWDWMNDPEINSRVWEWDNVCPSDQWKHSHNVVHHTWTNVIGKDRDVGYDVLRVTDAQPWKPAYLFQPIYNFVLMLFFEWGVAFHDIEVDRPLSKSKHLLRGIAKKATRQAVKDYVLWPALAGPFFFWVLAANVIANLIRNVWAYTIIFCGHFPEGVHLFTEKDVEGETRARFRVRQIMGSCNIEGGRLFHLMSGNLSHQIEHHLFPDLPSNRYPEIAPRVRALCARYGVPYNTGSLLRQFGTTTLKIWRLSFPSPRRPAIV
ncbi:MAG: acyl-CoA desaturase [Polyangiaceae bacterium]|nr:acyl-CoA desaturase [Polyangiaceae bacterium]